MRTAQGESITEKMLEALAEEAEAGYDPATLRPGGGVTGCARFDPLPRLSPIVHEEAQDDGC